MDFESDLCFIKNYTTDNMADFKAPTNTINDNSAASSTTTTTNNIEHNFHELCRSCGKTNAELYDLFQTTNSPFSTSSTTCYTHLNNCPPTSCSATSSSSSSSCTANKPSTSATFTDAASTKSSATAAITFDSMAATAKATAKGQSNMDNILQEMQIWQLLIKCNDGLPQRICAKCTAQFYMIHKFRRKCLKVQTQLRVLYEEQQKFYERQQQQQHKEKNVTVKDATIEATSTPAPAPATASAQGTTAVAVPEAAPLVKVLKPLVMHKLNDLVNDNYCEPQQAVVDNTNKKSSVPFEANTGNTNDFIAPSTTATTKLLDNVETMPQKTEANEPTPTSSAPAPASAFIDKTFEAKIQEHCVVTTELKLKDEKKPLLRPAVMVSKRSPPLTLQQPLEQTLCDNNYTTAADQMNASKKLCLDQELFLSTHIIFKTNNKYNDLKQYQENDEELSKKMDTKQVIGNTSLNSSTLSPASTKTNEPLKARLSQELNLPKDRGLSSKANSESLFITKAALKAYSIPPPTSETPNRDHQKPITNSEAIELKNTNDNNNNTHDGNIYFHRCDNRSEVLNDNTCSSTSNSTPPSSACSAKYQKRKNIARRRIIKYANSHNRRPGHCYKSNTTKAAATTKMARTIRSYGGRMVVVKKRKQRSQQDNKHNNNNSNNKLKCRLTPTETSSTIRGIHCQQQNIQMRHKNSIQMEDEMSSTVSTTSSAPSTSPSTSSTSPSPSSSSSSSAISSTSSHLKRATTPAATDLVRNCAGVTSFCRNANENINKIGCSSADRMSSNNSSACIMWKTKAAMKANANDMPVVANNDGEPTASNVPEISLPYIAPATPTGSTPSSLWSASSVTATATATETEKAKSSKTLYENQSNNSCLKNNKNNNNNNNQNNIILAEEYHTHNKITMSSPGNQVKDTKNEGKFLQNTKILSCNLWPEATAADQEQINTNSNQTDNQQNTVPIVAGNTQTIIECFHSDGHKKEVETSHIVDEQEKLTIPPTPPARSGSMKLIIQRKRGARFKCLRKDEDDETLDTQDNHKSSKPKRKRKHEPEQKLEMVSFLSLGADCANREDEEPIAIENVAKDEASESSKVPEFNSAEDENKENPISIANNYEFDSDSNVSVYRDPLLIRNEMLDEDTHVTDFSKTPLSLQTECTKEMYKQYKEKANLESPKKLLVRVPLTSLTQDFKRLHLTMDDQENETANEETAPDELTTQENNEEETPCIEVQKDSPIEQKSSSLGIASSSQSDLLGFSQSTASSSGTVDSLHPSIDIVRYINSPLCSASSKINDFINDFQNNCIDSSEIEDSCDMIPTLGQCITQELSDEIRDVEDTLNGIISEMHDKDNMYTPNSGKREELFPHSVYSPLTESPTTPSQSFYAESPCTINSNPMSVSPFIHHNMDYNAMTPQSNHSSMGYGSSYMSGGGSTGPHTSIYSSEHFPTYNECFEESNQSELIGFQNDIPCFENIDMVNELQAEANELDETGNPADNSACVDNKAELEASGEPLSYVDLSECNDNPDELPATQPTLTETSDPVQPHQISYNLASYQQLNNNPPFQMQNINNPFIPSTTASRPHYFVTNTNQGSILITSPQLNQGRDRIDTSFKHHNNNLQFVTLGQALKANQTQATPLINNNTNKISWPTAVNTATNFNQQSVLPTANGTTTYFINTNNGLYQANIPTTNIQTRPVNTIFVPPNTSQTFCKTNLDNTRTTIQQQPVANNPHSSQYIMLVNNLNGSSQYYATTPANLNQTAPSQPNIQTPTVLIHPVQAQNVQNTNQNYSSSQSNNEATASTQVPLSTPLEPQADATAGPLDIPKFNQQLHKHLKRRQQLLQPRNGNATQNITLICRFCHKRPKFTNNVDYSNHIINTHPAEKPYNCPHCPTHFSRRSDRQTHVTNCHGSRYQCAQCGLSFCAQRTLDFHLQKYHANLGRSHQHLRQNSSSATTTMAATTAPATYQLLQHNHQQRLVRVEDVHVQVTGENKNKRSINLTLNGEDDDDDGDDVDTNASQSQNEDEMLSHTVGTQQVQQQQQQQQQQERSRKLCCPDCNSDNDNCNFLNQNDDQSDYNSNATQTEAHNNSQQYAGNEGVVDNHTVQHVTIPSPEQTEPDSTTTLRHFRRRQLCEMSAHFAASASPSSSSSSSSLHNNAGSNDGGHDNINLNHNSPDNAFTGDGGGEQIAPERTLPDSHNCLLCEESFTNETALRKHRHLVHGAAKQSTTCSSAVATTSLVCWICKQTFRMHNTLQRHMETHNAEGRPYDCNICCVRFPRPSQLTLHKLTMHKFEKPNSCEDCGKQFGTECGMKTHMTEHEEATREKNASASEASTSSSQSQSQLSSPIYSDTIQTNTATAISATTIQKENTNLPATASGENSSASALINDETDACNNTIVSGLVT